MPDLVTVELLARAHRAGGGAWNAGEVAAFTPDEAAHLVRRGVGRIVPAKDVSGSPADRMVKGAPVKKGV